MNEQNYDQEMMMRQKVEKREKVDTIIAYCLIVILIGCIAILSILKLTKKEDVVKPDDHTPSYATLNDVVTNLNNSNLDITASTSNNAVVVTTKDGSLNLNIPLVNNELEVTYNKDNEEVVTNIYKEITTNLCVFYGNTNDICTSVVNNITKDSTVNGIRFVTEGDNTKVYINLLASIDISSYKEEYTEETIKDISINNYSLNINDVNVSNIVINNSDTDIVFTSDLKNNNSDKYTITIKLYDGNNNSIGEESKEYTTEDKLEIKFTYSDSLLKDNVKKYSINITR
mgnify:FL=1